MCGVEKHDTRPGLLYIEVRFCCRTFPSAPLSHKHIRNMQLSCPAVQLPQVSLDAETVLPHAMECRFTEDCIDRISGLRKSLRGGSLIVQEAAQ